jgi:peptidoglycan/LPS O-acetylase OafA/YrhL
VYPLVGAEERGGVPGTAKKASTIPALEGIRGVAASLVFLVHYHAAFGRLLVESSRGHGISAYLAAVGYHGVDIFFVLSGFLIYGALVDKPVRYAVFLKRRVRRIYPTFLAVLALYLVLSVVFPERSKLPSEGTVGYVLANALLLPGVFRIPPIVTVAWSLSYEIFFYVGICVLVAALALRRWPRAARLAAFGALAVLWCVSGGAVQRWVGNFVLFVPGILVFELSRLVGRKRGRVPPGVELVVAAAFVAVLLGIPYFSSVVSQGIRGAIAFTPGVVTFVSLSLTVAAVLYVAATHDGWIARVLALRPLRFLGTISYSFYLIHGLTVNAVFAALQAPLARVPTATYAAVYAPLGVVVYLAAVAVSYGLFRAVERPFSL